MIQYLLSNIFTKIGFSASLIVNSFFIWLTFFHIKNVVGTYKKLVVSFAIVKVLFSGLEVLAKPFAHNFNNSLFYFSLSSDWLPDEILRFAIALWIGFYILIVSSIAVQFLFRYLCLLGSVLTKNLSFWQDLSWIFYPLIPASFYTIAIYLFCLPDAYSYSYTKDDIAENYSLISSDVTRFIIAIYYLDGSIRWKSMVFLIFGGTLVFSHYFTIIYCGIRMHLGMRKELKKFSPPHRKLQKQFFMALVFQSLGPTIFIFMPAIPVLLSPIIPPSLGMATDWQTGLLYSMIGVDPPFDTIAFMVIVSEYGDVMRKQFRYAFCKGSQLAPTTIWLVADVAS